MQAEWQQQREHEMQTALEQTRATVHRMETQMELRMEQERLELLLQELQNKVEENPELQRFKDQILFEITQDGGWRERGTL